MNSTTKPHVNSPCCGGHFTFNTANLTNLFFYYAGNCTIIATYEQNGKVYLSISYDCGKTFEPPEEIMTVNGKITNLQVLSRGHQFVIAAQIQDSETGKDIKQAVSGWIDSKKMTASFKADEYTSSKNDKFCFKSCTVDRPSKLINVSLAFVKIPSRTSKTMDDLSSEIETHEADSGNDEVSVDYVFTQIGNEVYIECTIHCGLFQ